MKRVFFSTAFTLLILTIASISNATVVLEAGGATGVGDGGTGVVCTSPNGFKTYELLDLYEAKRTYGVELGISFNQTTYQTEISNFQSSFEAFTGNRSLAPNFFFAQAAYSSVQDGLSPSFDVLPFSVDIAPNCELRQIGYRYPGFGRALIAIDAETWRNLDSRRQALLMIHEALHDRFESGVEGANALRQLVAFIAAPPEFQVRNAALIQRVIATGVPARVQDFIR